MKPFLKNITLNVKKIKKVLLLKLPKFKNNFLNFLIQIHKIKTNVLNANIKNYLIISLFVIKNNILI